MNRWLLSLLSILVLVQVDAVSQDPDFTQQSPKPVMEEFCKSEAAGRQLSREGWHRMVELLVPPVREPRMEQMAVIRGYTVNEPIIEGNKARVSVEYVTLGVFDPGTLTFGPKGMDPEKITLERTLILTGKSARAIKGVEKEVGGRPMWRIEGQAEPHVSVLTAIRYLQRLRMKTTDEKVQKIADESLAALRQLL